MTTATKAAKDQLRSYIDRIERLEEEKKALAEDIKSIYAEAKSTGYDTKALRTIVRMRKQDTNERQEQEAILETYMHAIGMAIEAPLFAAVGAMGVDRAARDQVIEAFKQLVPDAGEIIVKMGGAPVRLFRDDKGKAHAEDVRDDEPKPVSEKPGRKLREPATVLTMVPKGPTPEEIKRIADDAEKASDAKRTPAKEPEPAPA